MCDLVLLVVAEPLIRQGVLVEDALHGVLAPFELLVLVGLEVGFVVRGAEVVVNEHRFRLISRGGQYLNSGLGMSSANSDLPR